MSNTTCTDPVVGDILAGWRYDISGLAPEMRGDYELHLAECQRCRGKQRLHRGIDLGLMALASASAALFLAAFAVVQHFAPVHALILKIAAATGFLLSLLVWLIVAVTTPAPLVAIDLARSGARRVHDRLPAEIRDRLPADLKAKL
jgi:hypothetical protein